MNNAKIIQNNLSGVQDERRTQMVEREAQLVKILESIRGVSNSKEWSSLKEMVFGDESLKLEKQLRDESLKDEPSPSKLRFIAGKLDMVKHHDLEYLESKYRTELLGLRKSLYGKEE